MQDDIRLPPALPDTETPEGGRGVDSEARTTVAVSLLLQPSCDLACKGVQPLVQAGANKPGAVGHNTPDETLASPARYGCIWTPEAACCSGRNNHAVTCDRNDFVVRQEPSGVSSMMACSALSWAVC